jgi:hypothetical protein
MDIQAINPFALVGASEAATEAVSNPDAFAEALRMASDPQSPAPAPLDLKALFAQEGIDLDLPSLPIDPALVNPRTPIEGLSGAPPGPEPPPGWPAVEEVARPEPNAPSQKPDFPPLPDLGIEMPPPFWEAAEATPTAAPTSPRREASDEDSHAVASHDVAPPAPTPVLRSDVFGIAPSPVDLPTPTQAPVAPVAPLPSSPIDAAPAPAVPVAPVAGAPAPATDSAPAGVPSPSPAPATSAAGVERAAVDLPGPDRPARADAVRSVSAPTPASDADRYSGESDFVDRPQSDAPRRADSPNRSDLDTRSDVFPTGMRLRSAEVAPPAPSKADLTSRTDYAANMPPLRSEVAPEGPEDAAPRPADAFRAAVSTQPIEAEDSAESSEWELGEPRSDAEVDADTATQRSDAKPTVMAAGDVRTPVTDTRSAAPASTRTLEVSERDSVIRQIADRAQILAAARPRDGVVVHLEPAHLGRIVLTVKSIGGMVDAKIEATDDRVVSALQGARPYLGAALEARGMTLTNVKVDAFEASASTSNHLGAQDNHRSGQQPHESAPRNFGERIFEADRPAPLNQEQIRAYSRQASGVDVWI